MKNADKSLYKIIQLIPVLIIIVTVILLRKRLVGVLIPITVAIISAYMLEPLVQSVQKCMKRKHIKSRNRAVGIVFVASIAVSLAAVSFVIPTVVSNIADIFEEADDLVPKLNRFIQNNISDEHAELKAKIGKAADSAAHSVSTKLDSIAASAASFSLYGRITETVVAVITALVLTYYFLKDKNMILNGLLGLFPYSWRAFVTETFRELAEISARFIKGQFLVALIVGVLETIGLYFLKMPYCVFFGLLGGISNMIPYFGPFLGAIPPVITALTISVPKGLYVLALFLIIQQLDNHFISPKIIEGNLGIHPATVIIVLLLGQEFFGIWGVAAAVPFYAAIKCLSLRIVKLIYEKNYNSKE